MENSYLVSFSGARIETTVTHKGSTVDSWIANIRFSFPNQEIVVGLDCEWRPNTRSWMNNPTATLQLCIGTRCLIIQLVYLDHIPESLKNFLRDPNVILVGVEIERDVTKIRDEYLLECRKVVDVREQTMRRWPNMFYKKPGLKDLARDLVGLEMLKPKHVCRSDWQARTLDRVQVEYACIDAYASHKIGMRLLKGA